MERQPIVGDPARSGAKTCPEKIDLGAIAALLIFCAIALAIASIWIKIDTGDLVGYAMLVAGIVLFGALSRRHKIIDTVTRKFIAAYLRFTG